MEEHDRSPAPQEATWQGQSLPAAADLEHELGDRLFAYPDSLHQLISDPWLFASIFIASCAALLLIIVRCRTSKRRDRAAESRAVVLNCWYCNHNQRVPLALEDRWTCDRCEATNVGFNEEGDYRTVPREMHDTSLNTSILPRDVVNPGASYFSVTRDTVSPHNILCANCQLNQTLWLQQVTAFVPKDPSNEDKEIEVFKRHLDEIYKLCDSCAVSVEQEIDRKHNVLDQMAIAKRMLQSTSNKARKMLTTKEIHRLLSKLFRLYRVVYSLCCIAILTDGLLYAKGSTAWIVAYLEHTLPAHNAHPWVAASFFPIHLLLSICAPRGRSPHRQPYQLFIEFFVCLLQAIPRFEMKSDHIPLDKTYSYLMLYSLALLLLLELPLVERVLLRLARPISASRPNAKKKERASFSSSIPSSISASSETFRQRHTQVPLAFHVPANPHGHLGVEHKLASISLFEEDTSMMDLDGH